MRELYKRRFHLVLFSAVFNPAFKSRRDGGLIVPPEKRY